MGYIKVYLEVLRYKTGINPTIPNFIFFKTPLFSMVFQVKGQSTPIFSFLKWCSARTVSQRWAMRIYRRIGKWNSLQHFTLT